MNIKNTDEYIGLFPENIANILKQIRKTIKQTAPKATETISYGMPAFQINGKPLVYFAAFKKHIGFYALPSGNDAFKKELQNYKTGKGSIQFPLNKEIPFNLIVKIVTFRIEEIKKNERI
jgi:uncharacterized protein YdhG (YjbR/CyaY superfamily)